MRVGLFITCINDTLFPRTGIATVEVLERMGCEVVFPEDQTCCGQMHANSGYREQALPLVRRIAEHAYKAGAGLVTPFLSDEEITLSRYRHGHDDSFDRAAGWLYEGMAKAFSSNTARLAVVGDNPMLLSGEDPAKVARASKANSMAYQPALEKIVNFETNWNIIAYPSTSWAKQVFPDDPEDVAIA